MSRLSIAVLAFGLFWCSHNAIAQNSQERCAECRSPKTGILLSAAGTAAPIVLGGLLTSIEGDEDIGTGNGGLDGVGVALIFAGGIVGPGAGHLYGGRTGHFLAGTGIRSLGLVLIAGSLVSQFSEYADPTVGTYLVGWGGLGIYLGSALYDIATASEAVHRYNAKHQPPPVTIGAGRIGSTAGYGLTLRVGF